MQTLKESHPAAIPKRLLESEDPRDQELVRIGKLANQLYSNFCSETRVEEPYQLLASILRHLEPNYFNPPIYSRKSTKELLDPNMAEQVKSLYKFVGTSSLSGLLKAHVCGDAAGFLKDVCQVSADELGQLKRSFDIAVFMEEFWNVE
jgi:hypothetical protein